MKRWMKWTLGVGGGLVVLLAGSFAWMASRIRPTIALGAPAPAVTLRDAAGKTLDLASFRGRPLFLDFWRST